MTDNAKAIRTLSGPRGDVAAARTCRRRETVFRCDRVDHPVGVRSKSTVTWWCSTVPRGNGQTRLLATDRLL